MSAPAPRAAPTIAEARVARRATSDMSSAATGQPSNATHDAGSRNAARTLLATRAPRAGSVSSGSATAVYGAA